MWLGISGGGHGRMRASGSCCPSGGDQRERVNETHERIKHDHQTETLPPPIVYTSLHQKFRKCYNAESIYPALISQTSAKGGERMADPELDDLHSYSNVRLSCHPLLISARYNVV